MAEENSQQPVTKEDMQDLLAEQSKVILDAVDTKLSTMKIEMSADFDDKLTKMEERFTTKLDKLTTTLDKFLKRMTDMEDEFTIMKKDLNRMKQVIKDKLGVDLT